MVNPLVPNGDNSRFPAFSCIHRGMVIGTDLRQTSEDEQQHFPIYQCRLHGACMASHHPAKPELQACNDCLDRERPFLKGESVEPSCNKVQYDVDVFLPYYSCLHFVPAAIESILWQKNVTVMLHLVNDSSQEDDQFLLDRYFGVPHIRWYKTTRNVGPYVICNALFYYMQSEYLAMMGADDIALPDRLSHTLQQLIIHGSEIHSAAMENFLNPMEQHYDYNIEFVKRTPVYRSSASKKGVLVNSAMVVKRATFQKMNGYDGSAFCGGDTEFGRRAHCAGMKISASNKIVGLRRVHGQSLARGQGEWGIHSTNRKKISEKWKNRFHQWDQQQGEFNPAEWGTLNKTNPNLLNLLLRSPR